MRLEKLELETWMCFDKKTYTFDDMNVWKMPNGTGKTSMISAIIYALYGKKPTGITKEDLSKDGVNNFTVKLYFSHNYQEYCVIRTFKDCSFYKNEELVARTAVTVTEEINKLLPENVVLGLWGYESLALSPVLNSNYLFTLLADEFKEPLAVKDYFQQNKTSAQRRLQQLKKNTDDTVCQADLDKLKAEIDVLNEKVKNRVLIQDSELTKARQCESLYPEYQNIKSLLNKAKMYYSREECLNLKQFVKMTEEEYKQYFTALRQELDKEKSKSLDPLAKYPRTVVTNMITEMNQTKKNLFDDREFHGRSVNYDTVDSAKITDLENRLSYEKYELNKIKASIQYWVYVKKVDDLSYLDEYDWQSIIDKYDSENKVLFRELEDKKAEYDIKNKTFSKINDILNAQKEYDECKENISITDQYISDSKEHFSTSILTETNKILSSINYRYSNLCIVDGVYKLNVLNMGTGETHQLSVGCCSDGEKTLIAFSLILAIRNIFIGKDVIMIMDEPFSNLDGDNLEVVNELLKDDKSQWLVVQH